MPSSVVCALRCRTITAAHVDCTVATKTSPHVDQGIVPTLTELFSYLPHDAMRKRGPCYFPVFGVRLCVHLSVTFVYCIQTAEDIVKLLSRPGSTVFLVF